MDRSMSHSSHESESHDGTSSSLPPWERRAVTQVPFVDASSPALSDVERRALPDLWAVHANAASRPPRKSRTERNASASDDDGWRAPSDRRVNPWNRDNGPWTSLPPQTTAAPYETQIYIPPAPKTAPPPSRYVAPKAPPTPPESLSNSSTFSSSAASPGQVHTAITALPGTMSSRSREGSRHRAKSSNRNRSASKHSKAESLSFGHRFKSAFKDMFKRDPIDESQFERIQDRHWTDEY